MKNTNRLLKSSLKMWTMSEVVDNEISEHHRVSEEDLCSKICENQWPDDDDDGDDQQIGWCVKLWLKMLGLIRWKSYLLYMLSMLLEMPKWGSTWIYLILMIC